MPYFGIPIRNGLPIGLGSVAGFGVQQFSPADLFSAGEQGAWYDPSDFSTLFTDSAGTTPVTAVEQFVGLMLDKSKGGVGTNGAARYNLLTYSEDQSNAIWSNFSATQSSNVAVAPNGTTTADKIVETAGSALQARYNTITGLTSVAYTASMYFKQASGADRQYANLSVSGSGSANWFAATFDLTGAGAVVKTGAGASGTYQSSSITAVGNGWYHCIVTGLTGQTGTSYFYAGPSDISNPTYTSFGVVSYTGDTAKGVLVWGADLRPASQANLAPTYQRITDSWSATIPGNHAFQTNSTKRPKLAARYNLLTYSEQFDNGVWSKFAMNVTANAGVAPDGTNTADKLVPTAATTVHTIYNTSAINTVSGTQYAGSVYAKADGYNFLAVALNIGGGYTRAVCVDLTTGATSNPGPSGTYTVTSVGNGWWRITASGSATTTSGYWELWPASTAIAPGPVTTGNGTDGVLVWGADLRPASQATGLIGPTYQRVVDATTYDAVGFLPYLQFDGLDDSMSTNSIDFTATDKMTVWAGVRKLSDAGYSAVAELGNWNGYVDGFGFSAPGSAAANYLASLLGTPTAFANSFYTTYASPITNILQYSYDRSKASIAAQIVGRINATNVNASSTGGSAVPNSNFGNLPLFIGGRNNTSSFFNGWLTSLIVRGAQSTQSQIEATESWVNGKTGAY
jgi:hypothetical protein